MKQVNQAGQGFPRRIKKSKFIGSAAPVSSETEAQEFIHQIKEQHNKATHNCWAYQIYHSDDIIQNESDDGEPSGTAGQPILYVLEQQKIVNTVIVITRYYGGIKLGKGGLVREYTKTTTQLLKAIGTTPFHPK